MKLTQTTLDYYRQRRRLPSWASKVTRHKYRPDEKLITIDQVLNSQWGLRFEKTFCAHNTMNLCRFAIKQHQDLATRLALLMDDPGTTIEAERRSAYARKWLYRLIVNRFPVGTVVTMHQYGYFKALGGFTSRAVVKRIDTKFVTIEGIHGAMTITMKEFLRGCEGIFEEN